MTPVDGERERLRYKGDPHPQRREFEHWYVCQGWLDLYPIGSQKCGDQWEAWLACHESDATRIASLESQISALRADSESWRKLYMRAFNEACGLTNYVENRPELTGAERRMAAIESDARALAIPSAASIGEGGLGDAGREMK